MPFVERIENFLPVPIELRDFVRPNEQVLEPRAVESVAVVSIAPDSNVDRELIDASRLFVEERQSEDRNLSLREAAIERSLYELSEELPEPIRVYGQNNRLHRLALYGTFVIDVYV